MKMLWCRLLFPIVLLITEISAQEFISKNLTSYTSDTLELECEVPTNAVFVTWIEVLGDGSETELFILTVSSGETADTRQGDKYDNFGHTQNPTSFYNLIITDVTKDDDGAYRCNNNPGDDVQFQVDVEVPGTVSIKNGSQDVDTLMVTVGEVYEITCSAKGTKSKKDLFFDWEPDLEGGTVDSQQNAEDADLLDYTITSRYRPRKEDTGITCQLTGYVTQEEIKDYVVDSITLSVRYKPECNMTISQEDSDCSMVILNCQCTAVPTEIKEYSFYNGSILINTTGDNTFTVDVDYGTTSQFSCQASNDEGTGEESPGKELLCEEATVTTSTTPTKEGNPTDSPGPSVALIASLSACGVILIVICVIGVIWFLKNRDGDSNKKPDSPNDDTSNTMPLYGEVKKDRKKKSDKPDGNGAGPESDMPTYADVNKPPQPTAAPRTSQKVPDDQPMQELQYADLDHGKQQPTNEIRKPQEEPTEYATVQSVIV